MEYLTEEELEALNQEIRDEVISQYDIYNREWN